MAGYGYSLAFIFSLANHNLAWGFANNKASFCLIICIFNCLVVTNRGHIAGNLGSNAIIVVIHTSCINGDGAVGGHVAVDITASDGDRTVCIQRTGGAGAAGTDNTILYGNSAGSGHIAYGAAVYNYVSIAGNCAANFTAIDYLDSSIPSVYIGDNTAVYNQGAALFQHNITDSASYSQGGISRYNHLIACICAQVDGLIPNYGGGAEDVAGSLIPFRAV